MAKRPTRQCLNVERRKERVGFVTQQQDGQDHYRCGRAREVQHRLYKKGVKQTKTFKAHDEKNECQIGDLVRIRETRPLSKTKRWRLVEIVKRAE